MRPQGNRRRATPRSYRRAAAVVFTILAGVVLLLVVSEAMEEPPVTTTPLAAEAATTTVFTPPATAASTTTTMPTTTTASETPPPPGPRYEVPATEASPEVKQLAVDIAYHLTTYEGADDHPARLAVLDSRGGLEPLLEASAPLTSAGKWSRGRVIYPQLGGLRNGRASVMVVTEQVVGSGPESEFSVVRTLDLRFVEDDDGWKFDYLSSAGGAFDDLEALVVAHEVAADPRIEMPDSARLDILSGLVSPQLLEVMADLADQTPYGVTVFATGHPHNVFETDRQSHHTIGLAVDIYRIGDRNVNSDLDEGSETWKTVAWLYANSDVRQVGSPWDLDGTRNSRSFTDEVHLDHIHLAVED
jgi:hypothetical protein